MRILHTVSSLFPETGGPSRSVPGLAGAQVSEDMEIYLWAKNVPPDYIPPQGVQLVCGGLDQCAKLMAKVDVVHDHGVWLPLNHQIAKAARRASCKRVVSPRGMLEPWAINHKKWKKRLAWWLYQHRDLETAVLFHATAESEAGQFRRLGLEAPITVIPNGVAVPCDTGQTPEDRNQSETGERVALFLSRVHPKKGLPMLIDAWAKVKPEGWRMRVVGPDEDGHLHELKQRVEEAGLSDCWDFDEPLDGDDKWKAYRAADLFILPTHSENFGIVVAEALGCGVPVITTHGTPWQSLEREGSGWWVPVNETAIADALRDAISRPKAELLAMGERGRAMVVKDFGWERIAAQMAASYQWILGKGEKPGCIVS
ncbi:glycosyltransferase [Verrucomicrobiaceae bacterium 5K15]|uniref:Glycosyltransferase n=1 Tax=Oceaniferula flava TaxID=2800421 RepID=A0AAE2V961_9BACT|nr:glycosyltransferase [Oceaniferula flavus]MBK1856542.1 glycosyltransferase [Oceaniferula flavus]MBM1137849.1 glycosyltransferase [Oceaniferula flavus]